MYKCKPERNVAQMRLIVLLGFGSSLAAFVAGTAVSAYGSYVKLAGFMLLCVTIMLLIRYVLSEYEYTVDSESLTVTRITGSKRTDVCCISLVTAVALLSKEDYLKLPQSEKATVKYSLTQNLKAESYVFLCEFNGKRTSVEIEPNEAFAAIVRDRIDAAKKNNGDEAENDRGDLI